MASLSVRKISEKTYPLPAGKINLKPINLWQVSTFPMLLFIAFPLIALFLMITPQDIWFSLQQPKIILAIFTSLRTSVLSVGFTLLFGLPVAYFLSQRSGGMIRFVDTLTDLPTILPPAVAGVALLMAFGRMGLLGNWLSALGINIPFSSVAVIMAQVFVASPLFIKAAAIGFGAIDPEIKQAAALDGASRWQTLRYILIPITWPAILSGLVMTWARALGEFGATIIFAGNFPGRTQTMPLAIYLGFEVDLRLALTLAVILISFSFLVLVLVKQVLHHHISQI